MQAAVVKSKIENMNKKDTIEISFISSNKAQGNSYGILFSCFSANQDKKSVIVLPKI